MREWAERGPVPVGPQAMTTVGTVEARRRFGDALALRDLGAEESTRIVDAASRFLVDGYGGNAVVSLASVTAPYLTSRFELDDHVDVARPELGMPRLHDADTKVRATQAMLRRWQAGGITDQDLASWVTHWYGYEFPDALRGMWQVGYDFEIMEWSLAVTPESIHTDLALIADEVLALRDPWL
jgi:hypothetical protein